MKNCPASGAGGGIGETQLTPDAFFVIYLDIHVFLTFPGLFEKGFQNADL